MDLSVGFGRSVISNENAINKISKFSNVDVAKLQSIFNNENNDSLKSNNSLNEILNNDSVSNENGKEYLSGAQTKIVLSAKALDENMYSVTPALEKLFAELSEDLKVKNEGYISDSGEITVADIKPTDYQQAEIDEIVYEQLNILNSEEYPGEVKNKVAYKDEDGNLVKEVIIKEDGFGNQYSLTIEYDDKGRVSCVDRSRYGNTNGLKQSFTYNDDGTITVHSEQKGNPLSSVLTSKIPDYKISKDGSTIKENQNRMQF